MATTPLRGRCDDCVARVAQSTECQTMPELSPLLTVRSRLQTIGRAPRTRRWGKGILIFLILFGVLGFFAAPPLIRHVAEQQLGMLLARPVTIGRVALNPYTLALAADRVRIGEREGTDAFVTLNQLRIRPSWTSLFRGKPIIAELLLDAPNIFIVRSDAQHFNFSDLIEKFAKSAPTPDNGKPTLFSVANIRIENGLIDFDDRLLGAHHRIDQWQLGIPFIANLPSKTEIFVRPLLAAHIDGSPMAITGEVKPFSNSRESEIAVKLDALDLPQLLSYLPTPPPVKLTKGRLSTALDIRFSMADGQPRVEASGTVDIDDLAVVDRHGEALFAAAAIHVMAESAEPLRKVFHLGELRIERPVLAVSRDAKGVLNLGELAPAPSDAKPAASATPAVPLDVTLKQFALNEGSIRFEDRQAGASLSLDKLALTLGDFAMLSKEPARYTLAASLAQGGEFSSEGALVFSARTVDAKLAIDRLTLAVFQPYLAPLIDARIAQGTLDLHTGLKLDGSGSVLSVQAESGELVLDALRVVAGARPHPVIELARATAHIGLIDLAARKAELPGLEVDGLVVNAERAGDGSIDLAALVKRDGSRTAAKAAPVEAAWHYAIANLALTRSTIGFVDRMNAAPVTLRVSPLQVKVQNLSDDTAKPWGLDLSGTLQSKGTFALRGALTVAPLKLAAHITASALDLATFEPYFGAKLNASIASALLGMNGDLTLSQAGETWKVLYKGDAALGDVRMLDKKTSDLFAGWKSLSVSQVKAAYDERGPDVDIGRIALSQFFARIFLDSSGQLNLGNIVAQENAPTQSLTRADEPASAPVVAAAAPAVPPANLRFGEIVLSGGNVDYTDNFIKPNFSADLTGIEGRIGAFGTQSTEAAPVQLKARLNESGPVVIDGKVNPLAATPFLDLTASARDIELTRFATYSTKYTGYPIVKGKLLVDLHYLLDQGRLTANNHLFIDQLTFGDRVDSPTATSLPVRFAISLLKNRRGEIDIDVPVSGSLSDPQFSVGSLIWHAFVNLIEKAVTAPFSLLAGAFGGGADHEKMSYAEFAAGSATLSDAEAAKIETLAKALADRPSIQLELVGRVDPALDGPALKAAAVERQIKLQKIKDVVGKGASIDVESVSIPAEEYAKYLTRAYQAADFKKPRNAVGLAKSLPPDEMKALLLANAVVVDADLLSLAQRRASAVQERLAGKVEADRIFVVAPKLDASDIKEGTPTRVEFMLKS